jgi:hypothetical protein
MRLTLAIITLVLAPVAGWSDGHTICSGTHECAQKMLIALASLNEADAAMDGALGTLQDALNSENDAHELRTAEALAAAKAYIDQRFTDIGTGNTDVPGFGTHRTELCKAGFYMVGARVSVASGGNAGMLYNGLVPICRRMK